MELTFPSLRSQIGFQVGNGPSRSTQREQRHENCVARRKYSPISPTMARTGRKDQSRDDKLLPRPS